MKREVAEKLLNMVRDDYNRIADDFSRTREVMWSDLEPFVEYSIAGDKVLDLGCGNGRLFEALKGKNIDYVGVDNSEKLIEIARQRHPQAKFQITDGISLPFPENNFNKIYCIAVLHHVPSKELRVKFLQETKRVLKQNGTLILTVWKLGQRQSLKLLLKYTFLKLLGLSKLDFGDVLVSWGKTCQRYKHNFSERGLKKLLVQVGLEAKETGTLWRPEKKNANIYVVARKV